MVLIIIAVFCALFYNSNFRIDVTEYEIRSPDIPEGFDGFRIVQLSDLHLKEFGEENSKLLSLVNEAKPDMIAVTGDLADRDDYINYVNHLITELVKRAPVYYVSGNHEWADCDARELFNVIESCGGTVLRNEYEIIKLNGDEIVLAGVDDPNGPYDMKTPEELVSEIRENAGGRYTVMLAHRNTEMDTWNRLGIPLVLCGHAHGGLVRLPFTDGLVAPGMHWFPSCTSGVYTEGKTTMVVSRGLGNTGRTFRLFNRPHIPVVILRTEKPA